MSEEEKEAINFFNEILEEFKCCKSEYTITREDEYGILKYLSIILNYIDKLQKENQELKEDNSHQWEKRCRLTFELERLQEENEKINKVADKMYDYISYYGWEDFESNTGCNRDNMVDYFYKE